MFHELQTDEVIARVDILQLCIVILVNYSSVFIYLSIIFFLHFPFH